MAVTASPAFVQSPKVTVQNFVEGTDAAATKKTIYTGTTNGSKVVAISAASDADETHLVSVYITRSAVDYYLCAGTIVATGAGTATGIPPLDLLFLCPSLPVDNDGQRYLFLNTGDTLRATFATAFTGSSGHRIDITVVAGDF